MVDVVRPPPHSGWVVAVPAVGVRANREDEQTGRFFQDCYHATRLADESSLLACAAYVDLNPIRTAMAETLEQSNHMSVQQRIQALVDGATVASELGTGADCSVGAKTSCGEARDGRSRRSTMCDDGFLSMPIEDYLELLDWTARHTAPGKRGRTPAGAPPILVRFGLDTATWCELLNDFGRLFCSAAGRPEWWTRCDVTGPIAAITFASAPASC